MAYSVKVSVPDQDGYKVSGSSSTIVGNLEKGDYTIASFDVSNASGYRDTTEGGAGTSRFLQAGANGETNFCFYGIQSAKVQIEYTDAKGERITVDKEVELETTSGNMTAAGAGGPGSSAAELVRTYHILY